MVATWSSMLAVLMAVLVAREVLEAALLFLGLEDLSQGRVRVRVRARVRVRVRVPWACPRLQRKQKLRRTQKTVGQMQYLDWIPLLQCCCRDTVDP
jgi:hypothetical protein